MIYDQINRTVKSGILFNNSNEIQITTTIWILYNFLTPRFKYSLNAALLIL